MNYIIFDLEFNQPFKINKITRQLECGYINPKIPQEIIEIGAVKLNSIFEIIDTFRIYVKPTVYKYLHPKIKKITKITPNELEYAFPFDKSVKYFQQWLKEDYILCSWSMDDIIEIKRNCKYHNIDIDWIKNYIDIQHVYISEKGLSQQISLKKAALELKIEIENRMHKALDDSLYTAKVLQLLNIKDIDQYILDSDNFTIYRSEKILDINDERIDKQKLKRKCPECGKFISVKHNWKTSSSSFWSLCLCNSCNKYISCNAEIKVNIGNELTYKIKSKHLNDELFEKLRLNFK